MACVRFDHGSGRGVSLPSSSNGGKSGLPADDPPRRAGSCCRARKWIDAGRIAATASALARIPAIPPRQGGRRIIRAARMSRRWVGNRPDKGARFLHIAETGLVGSTGPEWSGTPPELQMSETSFRDLPLYSCDYDSDFPPAAKAFKEAIAPVDAVLFVTPEYNRSIPGGQ